MRYTAASLALALTAGAIFLLWPAAVAGLDARILDVLTRWAGPGRASGEIAIVEIDEGALETYGRWPWRRELLGRLVGRILEEGAATVVLDMMFPEEEGGENDTFAEALRGKPVVIGYAFGFGRGGAAQTRCDPPALPLAVVRTNGDEGNTFFEATSAVCSADSIAAAAAGNGFLNIAPDSDGTVRRVPLIVQYRGRHHGSLALAAIMVRRQAGTLTMKADAEGARTLLLHKAAIALEGPSLLRLRFRGAA